MASLFFSKQKKMHLGFLIFYLNIIQQLYNKLQNTKITNTFASTNTKHTKLSLCTCQGRKKNNTSSFNYKEED